MKALSLWQPHAQAIALRLKRYETRCWPTSYRGPLAIHAARKKFDHREYPSAYYQSVCIQLGRAGCPIYGLDYGRVVCLVDLVDCELAWKVARKIGPATEFWGDFRERGDDGKVRYAFRLENLRVIPGYLRPEVMGRQGLFDVPDEIGKLG